MFSCPQKSSLHNDQDRLGLHARIKVRINKEWSRRQRAQSYSNQLSLRKSHFVNELINKKRLVQIISTVFRRCGNLVTANFLDQLKSMGFTYATKGGLSVSIGDVVIPQEKIELVRSSKRCGEVESQYFRGFITNGERYNKVIDIWTALRAELQTDC